MRSNMAPDSTPDSPVKWAAPLLGHRLLERWKTRATRGSGDLQPLQLLEEGFLHLSLCGQDGRLLIIRALDAFDVLHLYGWTGESWG